MAMFEFVADRDLRTSLDSDFREMQEALQNSMWKTVHVLAGSIVEALLIDHLQSIKHAGKDPLHMTLDEAVAAAKKADILSDKAAQLSTVIRHYRNLIHPGRLIRLSERVDANSAKVCDAVIGMISNEVAASRGQHYGYTAEQVASKIERDASAVAILKQILNKTNEFELERLLLEVIPERYFVIQSESFLDARENSLAQCFDAAYEHAPFNIRIKVAKKFVKILHEEDEQKVLTYEQVFFRASNLAHLDYEEQNTVKAHLLARLDRERSNVEVIQAAKGIGSYLTLDEVPKFAEPAIRMIANNKEPLKHTACREYLLSLFSLSPPGGDDKINKRIEVWEKFLDEKGRTDDANRVRQLRPDEAPF